MIHLRLGLQDIAHHISDKHSSCSVQTKSFDYFVAILFSDNIFLGSIYPEMESALLLEVGHACT